MTFSNDVNKWYADKNFDLEIVEGDAVAYVFKDHVILSKRDFLKLKKVILEERLNNLGGKVCSEAVSSL